MQLNAWDSCTRYIDFYNIKSCGMVDELILHVRAYLFVTVMFRNVLALYTSLNK